MSVRALALTDAAAWRRLFHEYGTFYGSEFSAEVLDRVWAILLEDDALHGLVAERDGVPVGIAHYRYHPDTFTGGWDWFLDDLYVSEESRGGGAATELIEVLIELAREKGEPGTLRWITAADNERAQRVYDRVATRASWITYEVRP